MAKKAKHIERTSYQSGEKRSYSILPSDYNKFLTELKQRIRVARVKASLSINRELIQLYWDIGKAIVKRQQVEGWGKSIVEHIARDVQLEFPGVAGFSPQNIWKMRSFYIAWAENTPILSQPVIELDGKVHQQTIGKSKKQSKLSQAVKEMGNIQLPQTIAEIPWGHNVVLTTKLKNHAQRLWYAQQTIIHGWSRSVLVHQIETGLYKRQGKAVSNFKATLPPIQSDLVQQIIKDPYNFEFPILDQQAREQELELEQGLLSHIRKFLLELGAGFAFVGQQVHLEVGGEDFYIDLLFYHLKLRCYVVIDLKMEAFRPEFAGKMNFYLSAVDDIFRHADDKPSIGLILCKTRNKMIAEYALRDVVKPVGIARYITKLVRLLPEQLKRSIPGTETNSKS